MAITEAPYLGFDMEKQVFQHSVFLLDKQQN
jgi:hypothetical protein